MFWLWLDNWIFGGGHGLATPYFDARFYWIVDTIRTRKRGKGRFYHWIGGHGAQLRGFQWRHPVPGERRRLCGQDFIPYQSRRRWLRVDVSWRMAGFPAGIDAANVTLAGLKRDLDVGIF
jgi:hypothetical protein